MPGLSLFNKRFVLPWYGLVLSILGIALLMYLGFWQLNRAEEKKIILANEAKKRAQLPIAWRVGDPIPDKHQRISVQGRMLEDVFLLDNQHGVNHQFGYHIISPLILKNGHILLVDRGFLPADSTRRVFPTVATPKEEVTLKGIVWFPSLSWSLGPMLERKNSKLTIIEHIDTKMISDILQKSVYPFIIRLQKTENYGFEREWVFVSMLPEKHHAYAIQWFAMALVLLVIVLGVSIRKKP